MCGKMETVELLLDKGVNFDLRDSDGRTVLEVMDQFTANPATEIRRKIEGSYKGRSIYPVNLISPFPLKRTWSTISIGRPLTPRLAAVV